MPVWPPGIQKLSWGTQRFYDDLRLYSVPYGTSDSVYFDLLLASYRYNTHAENTHAIARARTHTHTHAWQHPDQPFLIADVSACLCVRVCV